MYFLRGIWWPKVRGGKSPSRSRGLVGVFNPDYNAGNQNVRKKRRMDSVEMVAFTFMRVARLCAVVCRVIWISQFRRCLFPANLTITSWWCPSVWECSMDSGYLPVQPFLSCILVFHSGRLVLAAWRMELEHSLMCSAGTSPLPCFMSIACMVVKGIWHFLRGGGWLLSEREDWKQCTVVLSTA